MPAWVLAYFTRKKYEGRSPDSNRLRLFDPTDLEGHISERHAGKAMLVSNGESLIITIDCTICNRIEFTVPLAHISSVIQRLQRVAQEVDPDYETRATLVGEETGDDVEAGKRRYEQMPVDPRLDPTLGQLLDNVRKDDDPWK